GGNSRASRPSDVGGGTFLGTFDVCHSRLVRAFVIRAASFHIEVRTNFLANYTRVHRDRHRGDRVDHVPALGELAGTNGPAGHTRSGTDRTRPARGFHSHRPVPSGHFHQQ